MQTAFVTGVTGQDGSYLAEQLMAAGVEVHALVRDDRPRGEMPVADGVIEHVGDLSQPIGIQAIIRRVSPDVIFNLGGISSVARSWEEPVATGQISGIAVAAILQTALDTQERTGRGVRVVQASSSEIFGQAAKSPQNETTAIAPISPYGAAKAYGHALVGSFRSKGLHASAAILYNHESPRRPDSFVTRKITRAAALIARGELDTLDMGNLDSRRDWGWAPEYVDALVRMSVADEADDYVIATGVAHSVEEFVTAAFGRAGVPDWKSHVRIDERFVRPVDATAMVGDPSKAKAALGWVPQTAFADVVGRMVDHDLALLDGAIE